MILILTPFGLEHQALCKALRNTCGSSAPSQARGRIHVDHFGNQLALALGGRGKVQFALTAQFLIQELNPRLVVCAGGCGALAERVRPGDVIAATATVEHDFKREPRKPLPRFPGDSMSLQTLRLRVSDSAGFRLHLGEIASGDEDVATGLRAAEIARTTGALGVAWEGAGGARACRFYKVPFLELRAVTDFADARARADFASSIQIGMRHVQETLRFLDEDGIPADHST
ncbi:MAG: 5'-methylthioadenosine/S-adenosylhomocysteine nucleosidase [Bdellovibrionales bacterium]